MNARDRAVVEILIAHEKWVAAERADSPRLSGAALLTRQTARGTTDSRWARLPTRRRCPDGKPGARSHD